MKKIKLTAIAITIISIVLLVLSGCPQLEQPLAVEKEPEGNLTVTIPRFNFAARIPAEPGPWSPAGSRGGTAGDRAFLVADRVEIAVHDGDGTEIAAGTFTPDIMHDPETGTESTVVSLTVPEGSGYTLTADVYNLNVSDTDPVVTGTSGAFTVEYDAATQVSVSCVPVSATPLTAGTPVTLSQVSTTVDTSGEDWVITAGGGESWFSFTAPTSGVMELDFDLPEAGDIGQFRMAFRYFDSTGAFISGGCNNEVGALHGDGSLYNHTFTPGETYYFGCTLLGDGSERSFTVTPMQSAIITGTVTVPGQTDESFIDGSRLIILSDIYNGDWIEGVDYGEPEVIDGNLVYTYGIAYDGDEVGIVQAGWVQDMNLYPQVGDYMGAYDGDPGTEPDYITGEGIETTHFTGDVSGIDFVLNEITVIPPSLEYGFHFYGNDMVILHFNTTMDETSLEDPANYSVNINSGAAVEPENVLALDSFGLSSVALAFSNHGAGGLQLGDTLTVNISANVVSDLGTPMDADDRSPSYSFLVDMAAAGFDNTMINYDDPAAGNVSIGAIDADPGTAAIFDASFTPVNDGEAPDAVTVFAFQDSLFWGTFAGQTNGSPNSDPQDLSAVWSSALGPVTTGPDNEAITVDPEYQYQYSLSFFDTNQGGSSTVIYSGDVVTVDPTLPLDDSRVNVNIDFSYTGAGTVDDSHKVVVFLCYEPEGAPFAYRSFNTASGTAVFDDPLVPLGDTVYAEVYYDEDASMALSVNDPYTQYTTGIAASGGVASVSFDDSVVYSSGIPDTAGVWMTSSWGGMTMFFTEDAFSFTKTIDGGTTYGDVGFVNNYGTIVSVDNTQGYFIAQVIYHPSPLYIGKYYKVSWTTGGDFLHPEEIHYPFDTVQEAIDSVTPTDTLSDVSGLY